MGHQRWKKASKSVNFVLWRLCSASTDNCLLTGLYTCLRPLLGLSLCGKVCPSQLAFLLELHRNCPAATNFKPSCSWNIPFGYFSLPSLAVWFLTLAALAVAILFLVFLSRPLSHFLARLQISLPGLHCYMHILAKGRYNYTACSVISQDHPFPSTHFPSSVWNPEVHWWDPQGWWKLRLLE